VTNDGVGWRYRGLTVGFLAVAAAVVVAALAVPSKNEGPLTFDSGAWTAWDGADIVDDTRLRMVEDLRARGLLRGLDRSKVVGLLGEPSATWQPDSPSMQWFIGYVRPIGRAFLEVEFGADGRVVEEDVFSR
jgi:hypothetical protein